MSLALRPATRADVPALAELVRACDASQRAWAGQDLALPSLEEEALEWELRFARRGAWVQVAVDADAATRSSIVGAVAFAGATVSREDRTPVRGLAHVSAVFVHPDHWRRGVARTLLAAAEDAMRDDGYERAQLWTLADSPAEGLYRALGWSADGRRETYRPMGLEVVAYTKSLRWR